MASTPPSSQGSGVQSLMKPRGRTPGKNPSDLHFFDARQESDDEELQDAIATSHALVGESVVDSPTVPPKLKLESHSAGPAAPSLESSVGAETTSAGIVASGFAWVQKQQDRRRKRYLHNQAEQQLRKILEAQQKDDHNHKGLTENATFQTLQHTNSASSDENQNEIDESDIHDMAKISRSGDGFSGALDILAEDDEDELFIPKVRLLTDDEVDLESTPFVLSNDQMQQVATLVLPRGIAYARWKRLYSLARDGDSFDACLRLIQPHGRTLMVVRTSKNEIMGGFADSSWQPPQTHGSQYFGAATACLFRIDSSRPASKRLIPYRWTGANRYIQLCDIHHSMLAFGGGGESGAFGLAVEQDFQRGSTGPCATFDNEPLCSEENFQIVDLEIYGFLLGQF